MLADLAFLTKFRQICQISQNYASDFNKCHPATMADLERLADLAILAKFRQISENYPNDFRCWRI